MQPVKFLSLKNKYEYLKTDCLDDAEPLEPSESWTVTASRSERITITLARHSGGAWVYGYDVYRARGGVSTRKPSAEMGLFRSSRDAKLHAIGFMLVYLEYFQPETQMSIRAAEKSLIQLQLF